MDQAPQIAFTVTFVLGPLLCAALLQLPSRLWTLIALALGMVGSTLYALRLMGQDPARALLALWLGWVLAVAMVAVAIRRRITAPRARRWVTVFALLATTLPWFGLATARMMV